MHARVEIEPQPDHVTCGATCLHALYRWWGASASSLTRLIREVPRLPHGGTLGVHLAVHALQRGYEVDLYTHNLQMFDPTWFQGEVVLRDRLRGQAAHKRQPPLPHATEAYLRFLELGGRLHYEDLRPALLTDLTDRGPLLVGLSATYLYRSMREDPETGDYDDIGGLPVGHFVLLAGHEEGGRRFTVADPWQDNPLAEGRHYGVDYHRLAGAILTSIVTHDANLISITADD